MNRLITRITIATATFFAVAASLTVAARPASADDSLHAWTVENGAETCAGKCSPTGMCCRIVIVINS